MSDINTNKNLINNNRRKRKKMEIELLFNGVKVISLESTPKQDPLGRVKWGQEDRREGFDHQEAQSLFEMIASKMSPGKRPRKKSASFRELEGGRAPKRTLDYRGFWTPRYSSMGGLGPN